MIDDMKTVRILGTQEALPGMPANVRRSGQRGVLQCTQQNERRGMRRFFTAVVLAVMAVGLVFATGCARGGDDAFVPTDGYGTLDLSSVAVSVDEATTRAGATDSGESTAELSTRAVATDDFVMRIYAGETMVGEWPVSDRPAELLLKVGGYTLEIASPREADAPDADWETPWYVGRRDFTIALDQTTGVGTVEDPIVCGLGNIKVTVRYSEALRALVSGDAKVTVTIGDGSLVYDYGRTAAGYFGATGETSMTMRFEGIPDAEPVTETIEGVRPGEWERIFLYTDTADGAMTYHIAVYDNEIGQIEDGDNWGVF